MTKTGEEWYKEGEKFYREKNYRKAIECFNEVLNSNRIIWEIQKNIKITLEKMVNRKSEPILINSIADETLNYNLRIDIIEILAKTGCKNVLPVLIEKAINDREDIVRYHALAAMEILNSRETAGFAIKTLNHDENSSNRNNAVEILGRIKDERVIEAIKKALNDEDSFVKRTAAKTLVKLKGKEVRKHILKLLSDECKFVRETVLDLISQEHDPKLTEPLLNLLEKETFYDNKKKIAKILAKSGDKRAVLPLINAMSLDDIVKPDIVNALEELGETLNTKPVITALNHKNPFIHLAACCALSRKGDKRALKPLINYLKSDNPRRDFAARALGGIKDEKAVDFLIKALEDKDKWVRSEAIEALGKIGNKKAVDVLIKALDEEDKWIRERAVRALGEIGDKRAVMPIASVLLEHKFNDKLRVDAAYALGLIGDARALEALKKSSKGHAYSVIETAERAIKKIEGENPYISSEKTAEEKKTIHLRIEKENWKEQDYRDAVLYNIHFVDKENGWAAGFKEEIMEEEGPLKIVKYFGTILYTENGGKNWKSQEDNCSNSWLDWLYGVYFVNKENGWVVGDKGTVIRTCNGGMNWTFQESNVKSKLNRIYFADTETGWIVGDRGVILHTADGGMTWHIQHTGLTENFYELHFIDKKTGWIVGDNNTILHTCNGGKTWKSGKKITTQIIDIINACTIGSTIKDSLRSIYFPSSSKGWIAGDNGTILHTSDGGKNWEKQTSGTSYNLNSICFIDENNGWAAGDSIILYTSDGGLNWRYSETFEGINFYNINFTDKENGWTSGQAGSIPYSIKGKLFKYFPRERNK